MDEESGPRPRRAATLFLVAVWVLFAALYAGAARDERHIYFGGDQADLLSAADETRAGHPPLVGARSREGLFHPGPLFVYGLAVVQAVASGREAWTISIVSLLQSTSVLVLSLLTLRLSRSLALAASLPYLFVFNYSFLIYLRFLWNVTIVFPALALAVWLVVSIETPRPWKLPALAAVLSLIAQAHLGFFFVAGWLGAVAFARSILPPRRFHRRDFALAAGVLGLAWSPVLWEAVRHRGGNLAKVVARFSAPHERHPLSEVCGAIDSLLSELMGGGPGTRLLLAASLVLLAAASLRRGEWARKLRFLFMALSGSWIVFLLSVRAIPEPIQTYYLRPIWVITASTLVGGASALVFLLHDERYRLAVGLAIAAVVVAVSVRPALEMRRTFASPGWNTFPLAEFRVVVGEIAARVGPGEPRRADVEFQLADLVGAEPSFVYLLRRQGVTCERSLGAPRFRVAKASESPPESGWEQVLRTERYRLEADGISASALLDGNFLSRQAPNGDF
ncbi:MAG: hypothetical protein ACHQM4_09870 [Thermoanaerobaculia bacterium]